MSKLSLVFLGAPGAGKGTQATKVCEKYNIPHISTGDILRANIKEGTELGIQAKSFIDKGLLVPDEVVIGLVKDRLSKDDCKVGYLLDGFPRTIEQAKALDSFASIAMAINIEVDEQMVIDRIAGSNKPLSIKDLACIPNSDTCSKCGAKLYQRDDDKPETVKSRLEVYNKQTAPLIEYYNSKNVLFNVNGAQEVTKVLQDIEKVIDDNN